MTNIIRRHKTLPLYLTGVGGVGKASGKSVGCTGHQNVETEVNQDNAPEVKLQKGDLSSETTETATEHTNHTKG